MPESEARLEDRVLTSCSVRDGKLIRSQILGFGATEVQEALKAVGLEEHPPFGAATRSGAVDPESS
jgi:hypothetical protein